MGNRKIAYTLGRVWAYILTCSQLVGTRAQNVCQESGLRLFDISSTSRNMGAKCVQEFGPRFEVHKWNTNGAQIAVFLEKRYQ